MALSLYNVINCTLFCFSNRSHRVTHYWPRRETDEEATVLRGFVPGYGHIAPKTPWGKVVTIFYAVLGIPLMLICLSNIGDIMATSFRFLYWRVCCYMCTKKSKKMRRNKSIRAPESVTRVHIGDVGWIWWCFSGRLARSKNASFRRSVRNSTKSADSGYEYSMSRSDTDLRYVDERQNFRRGQSLPRMKISRSSQNSDPTRKISQHNQRSQSLDRRRVQRSNDLEMEFMMMSKAPVLCNKYVVGQTDVLANNVPPG